MTLELDIRDLSKRYPRGPQALDHISLSIGPGIFGLLGPNGAGKSTLMRILATLQDADEGTVRLGDLDPMKNRRALRRQLGYLPQDFGLDPSATAERLLDHLAELKGLTDRRRRRRAVGDMLERVHLERHRHRKLGTFSGGMKQRFGIAQALIGDPKLLIVDEPTTGLDPEERRRFFNTLAGLAERMIVILSTHLVDDVTELCDRMAVLKEGSLRFVGSPADALQRLHGHTWTVAATPAELEHRDDLTVLGHRRYLGSIRTHVLADRKPGPEFESTTPELEDVYFSILSGAMPTGTALSDPDSEPRAAGEEVAA
ncbi:MAG: ABC transporter ATP-binding protein [Acidobacteriota bacterium]